MVENNNNHQEEKHLEIESEIFTDVVTNVVGNLDEVFDSTENILTSQSLPFTNITPDKTHIQPISATLTHVQTEVELELPIHLPVVHLGKPNDHTPPDIDLSGFPHSQIVSRTHAKIFQEGDDFYIEDMGSANGTYINHAPLPTGNRHRLKNGDRIALGKEDKVSFIFQLKSSL